jgi:hypothetical protein
MQRRKRRQRRAVVRGPDRAANVRRTVHPFWRSVHLGLHLYPACAVGRTFVCAHGAAQADAAPAPALNPPRAAAAPTAAAAAAPPRRRRRQRPGRHG